MPKSTILHQSHNMELYFEVDDFDAFTEKLRGHLDVELVHPPMTHAWQQRVVRLYDPDWHMIEVGESMEHIALRLLDEGRSVEETAALIHHSTDFVEQWQKGFEIDMFGYEPEFVVCGDAGLLITMSAEESRLCCCTATARTARTGTPRYPS